jgi:AmpE protein
MKFLIIVIGLIIERSSSNRTIHRRFAWFENYATMLENHLPSGIVASAWLLLVYSLFPLLLLAALILYFVKGVLFGLPYFLISLIIFYYCLGPQAIFTHSEEHEKPSEQELAYYFIQVNGQLFAVIFWFVIAGPLAAFAYRLISLFKAQEHTSHTAVVVTNLLEWLPAKLTALLYLLVGNFQAGFHHFTRLFFTPPHNNDTMLSVCGLHAIGYTEHEVDMHQAQTLVDHATVVLLVLLALFTIIAWL